MKMQEEENAIQFKQKEVYDSKDRQRKGGRNIKTSDSEEHTKNHLIQYSGGMAINEEGNLKGYIEQGYIKGNV